MYIKIVLSKLSFFSLLFISGLGQLSFNVWLWKLSALLSWKSYANGYESRRSWNNIRRPKGTVVYIGFS